MATRPTFIDLTSKSHESMRNGISLPASGTSSPRMQHFAGDIPPAMSPLDMFAMQSRLLAKQLDDSKSNGRRVSRLPPLTTGDPITKQNSMYKRSRSAETQNVIAGSPPNRDEDPSGTMPAVEDPDFRPKSFYPRMSNIPRVEDEPGDQDDPTPDLPFVTPAEFNSVRTNDYFGAPRAKSPETAFPAGRSMEATDRNPLVYQPGNPDLFHQNQPQRELSIASTSSRGYNGSLAPPKSPHVRHAGSIRSIPQDSSDDEHSASTGRSGFSQHRKDSSSSGFSLPHSPFSTFAQAHGRSPSLNSEYSIGGSRQVRPTFNFSRPLSRASRPSTDIPSRQPSFDSRPSMDAVRPPFSSASRQPSSDSQRFLFVDDTVQTPVSMDNEQFPDPLHPLDAPAPSYIYAKFSLPRGRMLQRDSKILHNDQRAAVEGDRSQVPTNVRPRTPLANRPMTPTHSPKPSLELHRSSPRRSFDQRSQSATRTSHEQIPRGLPPPSFEQASSVSGRPSTDQRSNGSPEHNHRPPPKPVQSDAQSGYSASTRSGSTIKARPRVPAPSMELSPEDHLAKGIELHERGAARESTYHLRIAARQNLPTAMLLYALACRHGWGMRPNQQEGVQWLRKAADCASIEVAVNEDKDGNPADVTERKTRRAQFALSIYELGVSHMNGWGIEQDKSLALRCFEIAGNWGDADAMAEAGFCYAQGQGCKKDLKKAAHYYRMAEAKGMSMVGNSWIYKPKYAEYSDKNERQGQTTPEKKARDKSRTRTIFGRKKSVSVKP
ncbi:hypothetical protein IMSHALPRED_000442 [Imshaugia aleurites]|uniref:Uncharacterized protein n=1 Tax=Imshaugia aleurites TaxID=172621 RepID=A0A8H3GAB3_9LECA|nr:hypothetical protein IMSHALPRED_000442 [Imshaugia aleurites]